MDGHSNNEWNDTRQKIWFQKVEETVSHYNVSYKKNGQVGYGKDK